MKILFYSSKSTYSGDSFGGAERSMTVMAEAMAKMGHEVHFLSGRDKVRFAKSKRMTINGVNVHFLPAFKFVLQRFKPMRGLSEFTRRLIFQNYLSQEFYDFDIVYAYNEYPGLYQIVKWRESSKSKIKIVYRVAGHYLFHSVLTYNPNLKKKIEQFLINVDLINFNSVGLRDSFLGEVRFCFENIFFNKMLLLDIGVKPAFTNLNWKKREGQNFTIIMVANFATKAKRQDLLIEAFSKWSNKSARLLLLGDGPRFSVLKNICGRDVFLNERVEFSGFVSSKEILEKLVESSVFCLCTDNEGLSKSIAEAMSIGIPILTSNVSAINTYITHNENGILVENTVEAWVSALDKMYHSSKEDLEALSKREIAYAKEHFDVKKNAQKYIEAFESLIEA